MAEWLGAGLQSQSRWFNPSSTLLSLHIARVLHMPMATPELQREYQREWIARRRAEFFADKCCVECESTEDLELDHIDPTKKVHHAIWSWSKARREAELAKCQVLCAPCHLKKTIRQMIVTHGFTPYRHGTCRMYRRGCKCGLCRLWKKRENAKRGPRGWYHPTRKTA